MSSLFGDETSCIHFYILWTASSFILLGRRRGAYMANTTGGGAFGGGIYDPAVAQKGSRINLLELVP